MSVICSYWKATKSVSEKKENSHVCSKQDYNESLNAVSFFIISSPKDGSVISPVVFEFTTSCRKVMMSGFVAS